jgi:hypothetical protein
MACFFRPLLELLPRHGPVSTLLSRVLELMRLVWVHPKIASRWGHLTNNERAEFNAAQGLPPAPNEERASTWAVLNF